MRRAPARRCHKEQCGFSLIELAVAIAVLTGLLYFLLDRVLYMQEVAEKTEVEETIRSINFGLRLEATSRFVRGPDQGRVSLVKDNPIKWLSTPPRNYMGEHTEVSKSTKPGYWYFHSGERQLIYRPNRSEHLMIKGSKGKELRFDVRFDEGISQPRLVPLTPYSWFEDRAIGNR